MPQNQTTKIITNQQFRTFKNKLITIEQNNFNQIILIPRSGEKTKDKNWYEIAEHSALLYYYAVCEPLNETANFTADDNSYYNHYDIGLICMNGLTRIRLLLQKAGLYQEEKQLGEFYFFLLNRKFSKQDLDKFTEKELARRKANNQIIPVTFSDPDLYQTLRRTSENLHRICNDHMSRLSRETNGARIVTLIDKTLANYTYLCSLKSNSLIFWKTIYQDITKLSIEVQLAIAVKAINANDGILVCNLIKHAYDKIKRQYINLEKEKH